MRFDLEFVGRSDLAGQLRSPSELIDAAALALYADLEGRFSPANDRIENLVLEMRRSADAMNDPALRDSIDRVLGIHKAQREMPGPDTKFEPDRVRMPWPGPNTVFAPVIIEMRDHMTISLQESMDALHDQMTITLQESMANLPVMHMDFSVSETMHNLDAAPEQDPGSVPPDPPLVPPDLNSGDIPLHDIEATPVTPEAAALFDHYFASDLGTVQFPIDMPIADADGPSGIGTDALHDPGFMPGPHHD